MGTGNYNEKTAKQYTDLCLMTARPEIGEDAAALFRNMATANMEGNYKQLLVSPISCGTSAWSTSTGRSPRAETAISS